MTDDEILEMMVRIDPGTKRLPPGVKKIVLDAISIEREACAKVCEAHKTFDWRKNSDGEVVQIPRANHTILDKCADSIRMRSNVLHKGRRGSGVPVSESERS
jgi:hypothetical protein